VSDDLDTTEATPPAERPTPITDAFCAQYSHHFPNWLAEQFLAHSRRIERQLAERTEQRDRLAGALLQIHRESLDRISKETARAAITTTKGGKS
jgi:hypothetical protein